MFDELIEMVKTLEMLTKDGEKIADELSKLQGEFTQKVLELCKDNGWSFKLLMKFAVDGFEQLLEDLENSEDEK